ncbi:1,4-alpha-glucan branching protein GlgB [Streptococcus merionis]|uniref:1,4-alpha-glucan branching enzyme n=1 Tax=Streptococcus merionis TaxID=400065 RepID=A0A239SRV3_9STRE|nr:1,4-alpha-glucan branching protein GlgB [Streptococcus merionis]SNU87568.1 1,4-alpha-glucan branching enzyme [Streptococcus merionis]
MIQFGEQDLYYLNTGQHTNLYETMGAHIIKERNKIMGTQFRVYAPNAKEVFVIGQFNDWQKTHPMTTDGQGIFELYVPDVKSLVLYKYAIITHDGREIVKADPYAFYSETRPGTASSTYNSRYKFKDADWMYQRVDYDFKTAPVSIYELHLGSWKRRKDEQLDGEQPLDYFYSYKELAPLVIDYVKSHGFTHIELMPIMEHPLDASWGYQVTGYYSVTSRYGKPDELKYFVDQCHQAGIGVILDWVPLHFCKDAHGLYMFDGSPLYEYSHEHDRENYQWGTANFDLSKGSTQSFLLSNIKYWLEQFHFDGIRVDALSYLIYWRGETDDDKVNHPALNFIKRVNALVHTEFKGVMMIAEDSSSYPKVTHPLEEEGLGFDLKWDLGWMNDTLKYFERQPIHRTYHSNEITFGMFYNHNEQFILPLSHDEVVHGKLSIVEKMQGSYEDQFHQARAYYAYFYAHPGKNHLFMGNEWGHIREWHDYRQMDWFLLDYPIHQGFHDMMKTLTRFYRNNSALWAKDFQEDGFEWAKIDPSCNFYAFRRFSDEQELLVVNNFNDQNLYETELELPDNAEYKLVFSSNAIPTETFNLYVKDGKTTITVPRFTTYYLELVKPKAKRGRKPKKTK